MRRDFYEPDEPVEDVIAAFEHGIKHLTEKVRREIANKHRDEVVEGSGTVVKPARLDAVRTVRMSPDLSERLRAMADREGISVSDYLRALADRASRPVGFTCQHVTMTAGGSAALISASTYCGCDMQPVYAG